MTDVGARSVLWINHFALTPAEGGGTRHFELGRELAERGCAVQIAAADFHLHTRSYTRRSGSADRRTIRERVGGVDFVWLWSAPYQRNDWRRALNWLSFARSLLRLHPAGEGKPDLVIGSTPHLFAALAGFRLARRWGVPFVLEVRDLWPESMVAAGGRKGPVYFILDLLARYLYRRADRLITLARGTSRYLEEHRDVPADRMVYIPNGVDVGAFPEVDRSGRERFMLVYTGAHGPANGLEVVVAAARLLVDRPDIRFLLIGDGPAKPALIDRVRELGLDNVEFRDPVPKRAMPEVLAEADAGLMVLRNTPLFTFGVSPNKLFDYMGAGLPVVCNVPGEVAAMVREAGVGEQAEPGSASSLAAAARRLANTPDARRADMGRSARGWVSREHGRQVLAERLDALLRELVVT